MSASTTSSIWTVCRRPALVRPLVSCGQTSVADMYFGVRAQRSRQLAGTGGDGATKDRALSGAVLPTAVLGVGDDQQVLVVLRDGLEEATAPLAQLQSGLGVERGD